MKLFLGILLSLVYLQINLAFTAIAWILSPVLPAFASKDGWLPKWLWWFQTPDASLDGDSGWKDTSNHPYINKLPRYLRQVLWLIRNPAYGFSWTVLATSPLPSNPYHYFGDLYAKDKEGMFGWCFSWIEDTHYFHLKIYQKTIFSKCLKFRIGWNLTNSLIDKSYPNKVIKYCFTCNPFKTPQK